MTNKIYKLIKQVLEISCELNDLDLEERELAHQDDEGNFIGSVVTSRNKDAISLACFVIWKNTKLEEEDISNILKHKHNISVFPDKITNMLSYENRKKICKSSIRYIERELRINKLIN